jgi:hypothetical protein
MVHLTVIPFFSFSGIHPQDPLDFRLCRLRAALDTMAVKNGIQIKQIYVSVTWK